MNKDVEITKTLFGSYALQDCDSVPGLMLRTLFFPIDGPYYFYAKNISKPILDRNILGSIEIL